MKITQTILICFIFMSCNRKPEINFINFNKKNTSLPSFFVNEKDELLLSWVEKINDSTTSLNYSKLINGKWAKSNKITQGNDWFVNWADYPTISENNGVILTHFLNKSAKDTYTYDIKLNISKNGNDWQTNLELHNDNTKTEHGFVTMIPYKNNFFVTWLDGRNTANTNTDIHNHSEHSGAMTIRCAEVKPNGKIINRKLLDNKTCSCCQTSATITSNGPIVVYRDRTDNEIRDISITRYVDGKWITPQPIYNDQWMITGCPVNGPKIDAIENNVAIAWFTAVNDKPEVKIIFSKDNGANFSPPIIINKKHTLGRVDIKLIDAENAIVSWIEEKNSNFYLMAMKVHKSGKKGNVIPISKIDESRKSGFPQMEQLGNKIYFAWTNITEKNTDIKTASVETKFFDIP